MSSCYTCATHLIKICLVKKRYVVCQCVLLKVLFSCMQKQKKNFFSVIFRNRRESIGPKDNALRALGSKLLGKLVTQVWRPAWDWLFALENRECFSWPMNISAFQKQYFMVLVNSPLQEKFWGILHFSQFLLLNDAAVLAVKRMWGSECAVDTCF